MKNNKGTIHFIISFLITLLILVGFSIMSLTLIRMENTISPNNYTLFEASPIQNNILDITFINDKSSIDLSFINNHSTNWTSYSYKLPATLNLYKTAIIEFYYFIKNNIVGLII